MTARDEILRRLHREGDTARPPSWRSRRDFPDPVDRFCRALAAAHGEARRATDLEAALAVLGEILAELQARQVVANHEPPLDDVDLPARWPAIVWHRVGRGSGDLRSFCATADVGISGADAALAETGSLVVSSGVGRSRLATLLPPVHVALVSESVLTSDLFSWFADPAGDLPSALTFISGPSKTADIEQTLAVGVHGPKRLIAIVYRSS